MRELNTIELNEVNGAIGVPAFVAGHPYLTGGVAVLGLGLAAAYFGYKKFYSSSTVEAAVEAVEAAVNATNTTA